jgi:GNAT superfamily N-acetyltransferase
VVRPAVPGDAAAMADLHVRAWRTAYRGTVPDAILDGLSITARVDFWSSAITRASDPDALPRIWVLEEDGAVVGLATTRPCPDPDVPPGTGELHSIYLAPEVWSRGLGVPLMAAALDDLRSRGYGPLVLWVIEGNERGRRFYEREGWRSDGGRQPIDFGGVLVDEIRYRRD